METIRKSLQAINVAGSDSDDEEEQQQQQQQQQQKKHDPLRAGDRVLLTGISCSRVAATYGYVTNKSE